MFTVLDVTGKRKWITKYYNVTELRKRWDCRRYHYYGCAVERMKTHSKNRKKYGF